MFDDGACYLRRQWSLARKVACREALCPRGPRGEMRSGWAMGAMWVVSLT